MTVCGGDVGGGGGGSFPSLILYRINMSHLLLEPLHCLVLGDSMLIANSALSSLPVSHAVSGPGQHHVEIHSVDPNTRVVLDSQINVLLNAETKVAHVREILLSKLVLFDL